MSWSKVLNTIVEIKQLMNERGITISYEHSRGETCLERWFKELNDPLYNEMFQYIQTSQKDDLVLVRYAKYGDVFSGEDSVEYSDFWSMYDNFFRECRSMVIDVRNEEVVIAAPNKFFNINENEESSFENVQKLISECSRCEWSEKIDGSLQNARYYNGRIVMSASQAIDPDNSWRLADGIRMLNENDNYIKMVKNFPDWTFVFEYISLADAHVVNYEKSQEGLYLIGIRDSISGKQFPYSSVLAMKEMYGVKATELVNKTLEEVMSELDSKQSNEAEGFVLNVIDKNGECNYFKIKYLQYQSIHKILSNISSINLIIKNIADNTFDDLLSKVPDAYRWRVDVVANVVFDYIKSQRKIVSEYLNQVKHLPIKEAMIWIKSNVDKRWAGFVISAYKDGLENVNYIKMTSGRYKKMNEMGVNESQYGDLFRTEEIKRIKKR